MASIIPYDQVLRQAHAMGLRCVYHNSGAFAFLDPRQTHSIGWIGPQDETIRPEARPLIRPIPPPYERNLARRLVRAWRLIAPQSPAWVMPVGHWAYELQFGSREWMPALLEEMGIDPASLASRNQADAVVFAADEPERLEHVAQRLLEQLLGSDFAVLFPPHPLLLRLHHHKQIWCTTTSPDVLEALERCAHDEA